VPANQSKIGFLSIVIIVKKGRWFNKSQWQTEVTLVYLFVLTALWINDCCALRLRSHNNEKGNTVQQHNDNTADNNILVSCKVSFPA